jgi:hypothetical protein
VSYPAHPESLLVIDVHVSAVNESEWITDIFVNGKYDGPTDIATCSDYQIRWIRYGHRVLESGGATLALSSGKSVQQVWSSIITPTKKAGRVASALARFHRDGQLINASISPFKLDAQQMSYEWEGTVQTL